MSHSHDESSQPIEELAGLEITPSVDFSNRVIRRIEDRGTTAMVIEFLLVGVFCAIAGILGLGQSAPTGSSNMGEEDDA